MTARTEVTVVGSVHMDLIATAAEPPSLGVSVIGTSFTQSPGGKAGNQAAQLARLGVATNLVARVGNDPFGEQIAADLARAGVERACLTRSAEIATGASVVFGIGAEYASIIVPGAAATLSPSHLNSATTAFARSRFVVAQLELGSELALEALLRAQESGAETVLNASPLPADAGKSLAQLFGVTDVLIVNRHEAGKLAGSPIPNRTDAEDVAYHLANLLGIATVVVTCGSDGAVLVRNGRSTVADAFPVAVVDSVGAGDAFLGGLIAQWVAGRDDPTALRYASATGALAASGAGAFRALPDLRAVESFLTERS
jgi:ribokinase